MFARAAHAAEQQPVGVTQQAHADGQAGRVTQVVLHQPERAQVVGHLFHIVGVAHSKTGFVVEQIRESGLRAFNLRCQQRLFANGAV
ncbi:hypothetical protein D3C71_1456210 [compost metagenome]